MTCLHVGTSAPRAPAPMRLQPWRTAQAARASTAAPPGHPLRPGTGQGRSRRQPLRSRISGCAHAPTAPRRLAAAQQVAAASRRHSGVRRLHQRPPRVAATRQQTSPTPPGPPGPPWPPRRAPPPPPQCAPAAPGSRGRPSAPSCRMKPALGAAPGRALRTSASASSRRRPRSMTRYASTSATERLCPAKQCTSTAPLRRPCARAGHARVGRGDRHEGVGGWSRAAAPSGRPCTRAIGRPRRPADRRPRLHLPRARGAERAEHRSTRCGAPAGVPQAWRARRALPMKQFVSWKKRAMSSSASSNTGTALYRSRFLRRARASGRLPAFAPRRLPALAFRRLPALAQSGNATWRAPLPPWTWGDAGRAQEETQGAVRCWS
jgi:hypothetical protein